MLLIAISRLVFLLIFPQMDHIGAQQRRNRRSCSSYRWIDAVVSQETQKDSFELMHLDPGNTQLRGVIRTALETAS